MKLFTNNTAIIMFFFFLIPHLTIKYSLQHYANIGEYKHLSLMETLDYASHYPHCVD